MTRPPVSTPPPEGMLPEDGGVWRMPGEEELAGGWPDPYAGRPPEGDRWLDALSPEELDAMFGPVDDLLPDPDVTGAFTSPCGPQDGLPPGPALAGISRDIMAAGLGGLSDDELVGTLHAARRLAAWQNGVELAAVAELDARRLAQSGRPGWSRASEHVAEELAAALVLTGRSADLLLGLARDLARLPVILAALLAGTIDRARAAIFAAELAGLSDKDASAIARALADRAGSWTTGQLRAALRRRVLAADPAALRRRAAKARADARVEAWLEQSGNGALSGRELPAADTLAADQRITAIAAALKNAGAAGTLDQLRAAVFAALLAGRDLGTLLPASQTGRGAGTAGPGSAGPGSAGPGSAGPGSAGPGSAGPGSAGLGRRGGGPGTAGSGTGPAGTASSAAGLGLAALTGSVHLTMPAAAWLGLSDRPGEIPGYGPLDAWTCRDLASRLAAAGSGTRWHVTLTGPDGRAVAHACPRRSAGPPGPTGPPGPPGPPGPRGSPRPRPPYGFPARDGPCDQDRERAAAWLAGLTFRPVEQGSCSHAAQVPGYRPPNLIREQVRVRQRTCAFPGCRRPARTCDLDHTVPHDQGGRTCPCNLATLCRKHHRTKQAPGWHLAQPEPGTLVWTAPHGRSYTVSPDPYPV